MKNKLVVQMLNSGVYDHMSVSEFARAVKTAKRLEEFDVDKWAEETMAIHMGHPKEELDFLTDSLWKPKSVTIYTNRSL